MFNKVVLVGHLTRDIELRYLQTGTAIGKSAIAVTRKYTANNGQKAEETCFIDITFWGRIAEIANQYLRKGSKCLIEGSLKFEQWQDQNGQNRSKHSVSVENMEMLGDSSANSQQNNYGNQNSNQSGYAQQNYKQAQNNAQPQVAQQQVANEPNDVYNEDGETIPF
ncbi:single-stranded DNA-binding protein [Campylobacter sp. JMF_03 NE3]|uniref:single-stranded DNA-binding protein n=1 Tax=Campylobacter sp. JMF_03 NE3 TaxID=2983831 RepID=UPI0022E9E675|nr:single-stranded DNA-binding protein [Campylobacter sp. JMF_03 NE3]MDA3053545.1 single-stranded DNA-binding protein [Campylobacter sp. JMF_03 NE3]